MCLDFNMRVRIGHVSPHPMRTRGVDETIGSTLNGRCRMRQEASQGNIGTLSGYDKCISGMS
nr:MAG TPA: hypothetical protein [Caudoviricetes sp.]